MSKVHQIVYSDSYISRPQYRMSDVMMDMHQKQQYQSASESRTSLDSQAELLEGRSDKKMSEKLTLTSLETFFRWCCCASDSSIETKEKGTTETPKLDDRRWSKLEGTESPSRSENEFIPQSRGKPDGKEKSLSGSLSKSLSVSSYDSERKSLKHRYSGSDFDVIDLGENRMSGSCSTYNSTGESDSNAVARSKAYDRQDKRREMFGKEGFRDSVFDKLTEF